MTDFDKFLEEERLTPEALEHAKAVVHFDKWFPASELLLEIKPSPIEGVGVFAKVNLEEGTNVGTGRILGHWTELGRFMNHDANPNSVPVMTEPGKMDFLTTKFIGVGEELTCEYRNIKAVLLGGPQP